MTLSSTDPATRDRELRDALDALDVAYLDDNTSATDLAPYLPGILDYIGYLESALMITRACELSDVRQSARVSSKLMIERAGAQRA